MSFSPQNDADRNASVIDAERTLRLIATLPAPEGIADRVKSRLQDAPRKAGVIAWPSSASGARWTQFAALRGAAAAAIVIAVAGGAWELYTHIQIAPEPSAVATPQRMDGGRGGLSAAGAVRKPQTLDGPVVAAPAKSDEDKSDELLPKGNGAKPAGKKVRTPRLTPR
jgi:hypothetical protein